MTSFLLDAGQSDGGSRAMSRDREKERVLEAAKESWNAEGLPPVFVNVTWIERVEVAGSNRTALAEALVRAAKLEIPRPGYRVAREYPSAGWKELQRLGVDRLTVYGLKDPGETGWHSTWSGAIPGFKAGAAEIGRLFLEKEPCVAGYRTYASEIWLLIVAHGRNAVSDFHFYEEDETPSFTTSFDRAFLMSQSRGEFRELRLEVQGNG
ncbi:MAG: hypothetical protein ABI689_18730 [Thermoanaerobaculia bacterium]